MSERVRISLRAASRLFRPRVGLLAMLGAGTGFVLRLSWASPETSGTISWTSAWPVLAGAFLLAGGCSALNQYQERAADALMLRTRNRPLPAGTLSPRVALGLGLGGLLLAGLLLAAYGPLSAAIVPLTALIYNGLYTPLKKRSGLAMLVGGLAGALPPVLGWIAAGGNVLDAPCLWLAAVLYCWQVPHFWFFARLHAEDYRRAGFHVPEPGRLAGCPRLGVLIWILGYAVCLLAAPAFGLANGTVLRYYVTILALGVTASAGLILTNERLGFAVINLSLALVLGGLSVAALHPGP